MKCAKCGRPVTVGNSRLLPGRKFREHRHCPPREAGSGSLGKKRQARLPSRQTSEPQPIKSIEPDASLPVHRYFIRPAMFEKLEQVAYYGPFLTPVSIEVYSMPRELAEERPDLTEGLLELTIK